MNDLKTWIDSGCDQSQLDQLYNKYGSSTVLKSLLVGKTRKLFVAQAKAELEALAATNGIAKAEVSHDSGYSLLQSAKNNFAVAGQLHAQLKRAISDQERFQIMKQLHAYYTTAKSGFLDYDEFKDSGKLPEKPQEIDLAEGLSALECANRYRTIPGTISKINSKIEKLLGKDILSEQDSEKLASYKVQKQLYEDELNAVVERLNRFVIND